MKNKTAGIIPMEIGDKDALIRYTHHFYWCQGNKPKAIELLVGGMGFTEAGAKQKMEDLDKTVVI